MRDMTRRDALAGAAGFALTAATFNSLREAHAEGLELGPPEAFDFQQVKSLARSLAGLPHVEPPLTHEDFVQRLDRQHHSRINFKPDYALWPESLFPIRLHHRGRSFPHAVSIYLVENGEARPLVFDPAAFDYSELALDLPIPQDLGFAGFRLMNSADSNRDWLSFRGASCFQAAGEEDRYGIWARALAVDAALPEREEELPYFSRFWIEQAPQDSRRILLYGLLEGISMTGAFQFDIRHERGVVMEIRSELFFRRPVERLGIAPLNSMYWFDPHDRQSADDWRPRVHNSDGLAIWTGAGERIWRPLNNPDEAGSSSFLDDSPRGFGLLQRERNFENYQDDLHFFDRRPSVWVEPLGDWGAGAIELIETPTANPDEDNILVFWVPEAPTATGSRISLSYRLYWLSDEPYPSKAVARVVATRVGPAGVPGDRVARGHKFVIDFEGGPLEELLRSDPVEPVISVPSGEVQGPYALQVAGTSRWRAVFDLVDAEGDALDLRLYLRLGEETLSETWLYQHLLYAPD